jgi:hypothetical protein
MPPTRVVVLGCGGATVELGRDWEGQDTPKTGMTDAKVSRKALAIRVLPDGTARIKSVRGRRARGARRESDQGEA